MPDLDVDRYCRAYEAGVRAARAELPDYLTNNDSFAEELRARLATQIPEVIREKDRTPFDPDAARFFDETGWVRAPGEFLRDAISRPRVKVSSPT